MTRLDFSNSGRAGATWPRLIALLALLALAGAASHAGTPQPAPDFTKQKTLYLVGYAHLDTQYRWTYTDTIGVCLPDTMRSNFALFDKYPDYVFNFSGANRYRMMKEYYPADYAQVKTWIQKGRWFPCGSSMEENDVNVPSAESIIRQVLYGNHYFRKEFGTASEEFMLPDCFGFPASLPSLLAHCGLKGFSTQKLSWHSANGIPFNVGVWQGLDGKGVVAALNCLSYGGDLKEDMSRSKEWLTRLEGDFTTCGLAVDMMYYGIGDRGGAPREVSLQNLEQSLKGDGPIKVVSARADDMFKAITPEQAQKLPHYQGDLLLIEHSAGSITSEATMKRWNRKSELLADDAERASVAARWLGAAPYPRKKLNGAWTLVMGGEFHDVLPGTSQPKAYEYSWNDEILAQNQFAEITRTGAGAVAQALDTQAKGSAVIVYNPLSIEREEAVEANLFFKDGTPAALEAVGPDGKAAPAQILEAKGGQVKCLFLAKAPAVGYAVYDVRPASAEVKNESLKAAENTIENARYKVTLNAAGDVASIFDKSLQKELLAAPARLVFTHEKPTKYPAWNMDWEDRQQPPLGYVDGPATVKVIENGPVRVALEVTRQARGSKFIQRIRLAAGGAGERVEFANTIDWKTTESALRASFPLVASNPLATYNWEAGTIQRGNNAPNKYEVPAHQWFDLTDKSGAYGATVLSDCKYGSDKPGDSELRLTLLYSPGCRNRGDLDQATQDWGRHEILYGLAGHAGDWRGGLGAWAGQRLNQPMLVFTSPRHAGALGKTFSLASLSSPQVILKALKQAEDSDEIIVRLIELTGKPVQGVKLALAGPIAAAREVDGQERPLGEAKLESGKLVADFTPYAIRTFALKLGAAPARVESPQHALVMLPFNVCVASRDGQKCEKGFDGKGNAIAAEMLPLTVQSEGIEFLLGATTGQTPNAVACAGQTVMLPAGPFNRLYLLAAADSDVRAAFAIDGKETKVNVQSWGGYVGQWDNRIWTEAHIPAIAYQWWSDLKEVKPGYIKPAPVAWFASHHHDAAGANKPYEYSYLYKIALDLKEGSKTLTLPQNAKVKLLAATVAENQLDAIKPAAPLLDTLDRKDFNGKAFTWQVPAEIAKASKKRKELKKGEIDKW